MAIVSTKGMYGLTAIIILAREKDEKLLQIKQIASQGDIPPNYLEQILVLLKKSEIVESIRGASGGYRLLKKPSEISVYQVLKTLDCCVSFADSKTSNQILEPFFEETQKKMEEFFSLTIQELDEFLLSKSKNMMYYI
ncbi:MAG: Rrf2 family transcriptional regulator [Campylobacterales bacterium]|nr:Rrf2 family transcriptional regulator [Campylobacterales bacterium]